MSVELQAYRKINDDWQNDVWLLSFPVSSERFFNEIWQKGIDELHINTIQNGKIITFNEISLLLKELKILKKWTYENFKTEDLRYISERIDRMLIEIPKILTNENIYIWIG